MKRLFSLLVVSLLFVALGLAENGPPNICVYNSGLNQKMVSLKIDAKGTETQKEVLTALPYFDFAHDMYQSGDFAVISAEKSKSGKAAYQSTVNQNQNQNKNNNSFNQKMVKIKKEVLTIWLNDQENNFKKVAGIFFLKWIQHEMTEGN